MASGSEREVYVDIFDSYLRHDLHSKGKQPIIERIRKALSECYHIIHFDNYLLQNYFNELSIDYTRHAFRMMLKLTVLFALCSALESYSTTGQMQSGDLYAIQTITVIALCIYFYTFRESRHKFYSIISIPFALAILLFFLSFSQASTSSPSIQLPMLLFLLLPLSLETQVTINIILYCISETVNNVFFNRTYGLNNTELPHLTISNNELKQAEWLWMMHTMNRLLTWANTLLVVIHIGFWQKLRRRVAFLRMGQSLLARNRSKRSLEGQRKWIDAIMPSEVSKEYCELRKKNMDLSNEMWVYSKPVDNVSILFADIVGFTKMSSSKTAQQVVYLLSDLYKGFDDLCEATKCEKIGTLGDCYYCVAGCPTPRVDHAECCIEMGLGMCRIIKRFNRLHGEDVNMRVGIHTGKVNAAIIGQLRFRYDVYSYDVAIANSMESSGLPGRVHISEATYQLVKHIYQVAPGPELEVKAEQFFGIAGMALRTVTMQTYFVNPLSSRLYHPGEKYGQLHSKSRNAVRAGGEQVTDSMISMTSASRLNSMLEAMISRRHGSSKPSLPLWKSVYEKKKPDTTLNWTQKPGDSAPRSYHTMVTTAAMKEHHKRQKHILAFINDLRKDPEEGISLFKAVPLRSFSFHFLNRSLEKAYQNSFRITDGAVYLDSLQFALMLDVISVCAVIFINLLITWAHIAQMQQVHPSFFIATASELLLILIGCTWSLSLTFGLKTDQPSKCWRNLLHISSHPAFRELVLMILSSVPCGHAVLFMHLFSKVPNPGEWPQNFLANVCIMCFIVNVVPLSSSPLIRLCNCLLCVAVMIVVHKHIEDTQLGMCSDENPLLQSDKNRLVFDVPQWALITLMLYIISRLNAQSYRLCFYVSREAQQSRTQAERTQKEAEDLLYNIIPKYVLEKLIMQRKDSAARSSTYAVSLPNVGIIFACISNFFSTYYREDYKGGESALKLLNAIICSFDQLLSRPMFAEVEKIKTINDCYMAASGLNESSAGHSDERRAHLVALMDFSFMLLDTLQEFNANYIIGSDHFALKIGYNFGPVTAGIIGTKKPMYDVWGDTVNVASRMYSTGKPGIVQVPVNVRDLLKDHYNFELIGEVFVKGKGIMETYSCTQRRYM